MKVHELIKELTSLPNQEAEIKILVGNNMYSVIELWKNSRPVVIEGGVKRD